MPPSLGYSALSVNLPLTLSGSILNLSQQKALTVQKTI